MPKFSDVMLCRVRNGLPPVACRDIKESQWLMCPVASYSLKFKKDTFYIIA